MRDAFGRSNDSHKVDVNRIFISAIIIYIYFFFQNEIQVIYFLLF